MILDSGNRREFDTGAVRDIEEGKGRCDLMPLYVASRMFVKETGDLDYVLMWLNSFMKNNVAPPLFTALDYFIEKAYSNDYPTALLEVSKHFEEGAKKYGENNWQKGIPVNCYIDSATRHYLKWLRGDKDEDHARAFVWNVMCCIFEVERHD